MQRFVSVCIFVSSVALWPDFGMESTACQGGMMQSVLSSRPPAATVAHSAQVTSMVCEAGCVCNKSVVGIELRSGPMW